MTDLSNMTLAELSAEYRSRAWKHYETDKAIDAVLAEIERRKAEPDYAEWEPKWQAFREAMGWKSVSYPFTWETYIRALIAAHNTPLAGEEWTEYQPSKDGVGPGGVSPETHEIKWLNQPNRWLPVNITLWRRGRLYRYRPKQTDEVKP